MNKASHLFVSKSLVDYEARCQKYGQKGLVVWFTGLSGSGKTTLSLEVEKRLFEQGRIIYQLDGDSLRSGLNSDLGFSESDRKENIRRVAELARLFQNAGVILLTSFISPHRDMRAYARSIVPLGSFIEVYVKASLATCIKRDPKGFYKRALSGEIKDYTGIAQDYEEPTSPELIVDTETMSLNECAQLVVQLITSYLNEGGDRIL
jgi:adenylyl-sulfate kinase